MTTGYSFHIVDDLTVDTGEGPFTLRRFFMPIGAAGGSKSPLNTVIGAAWPAGVPDSPHGTVAGEVRPTWSNNLYSFIVPVGPPEASAPLALVFEGKFKWTIFNRTGSAGFQAPNRKNPGTPMRLESLAGNAGYRVIKDDGEQWLYQYKLNSDPNVAPVLLSSILTPGGRPKVVIAYQSSGCPHRIDTVTFVSGAMLKYNYTNCLLTSVAYRPYNTSGTLDVVLAQYQYPGASPGRISLGGPVTAPQTHQYAPSGNGWNFTVNQTYDGGAGRLVATHQYILNGSPATSYAGNGEGPDFSFSFDTDELSEGFQTPYLGCNALFDDTTEDGGFLAGVPLQRQFRRTALSVTSGGSPTFTSAERHEEFTTYNDDIMGQGLASFAMRTESCDGGSAYGCRRADTGGPAVQINLVRPLQPTGATYLCSDGRDGGQPAVPFAQKNNRGWWTATRIAPLDAGQTPTAWATGMGMLPDLQGTSMTHPEALEWADLNPAASIQSLNGVRLNSRVELPSTITNASLPKAIFDQRFVDGGMMNGTQTVFMELEWQKGNTLQLDGAVAIKTRGTFYRRARVCGDTTPDPRGRILRVEGPCDISDENASGCSGTTYPVTEFLYDDAAAEVNARGRLLRVTRYASPTDCNSGLQTDFSNFTAEGFPQTVTDPNSDQTFYAMNGDKLQSITRSTGDGGTAITRFDYESDGSLKLITYPQGNFEVFCRHSSTAFACNWGTTLLPRVQFQAKSTNTDGSQFSERIEFTYNAAGELTNKFYRSSDVGMPLVEEIIRDASGRPTFVSRGWNDEVSERRRFDGNDNLLSVGNTFTLAPDFCMSGTTPSPLCTLNIWDRADRLTRVDRHPIPAQTESTCLDYDMQGNVRRSNQGCAATDACVLDHSSGGLSTCAGSPPTDYVIDDFGDVVSVKLPVGGSATPSETRYEYNALHKAIRRQTATMRAATTWEEMDYDALGRLALKRKRGTGGDVQLFALTWDKLATTPSGCPSTAQAHSMGRLARRTDTLGDTRYAYDPSGNVLAEYGIRTGATPFCDGAYTNSAYYPTTRYGYSKNGNLLSIRYPQGRTVNYVYGTGAKADRVAEVLVTNWQSSNSWSVPVQIISNVKWLPYSGLYSYVFSPGADPHTVTRTLANYAAGTDLCTEVAGSSTKLPSSEPNGDATLRQSGLAVVKASNAVMVKSFAWNGEQVTKEFTCFPTLGQTTEEVRTFAYDFTERLTSETRSNSPPRMTHGQGGAPITAPTAMTMIYDRRSNRTGTVMFDGCPNYLTQNSNSPDQLQVTAPNGTSACQGRFSGPTFSYDADGRVTQNATAWYYGYTNFSYGAANGSLDSVFHTASIYNKNNAWNQATTYAVSTYSYYFDAFGRRRLKVLPTGATQEFFYSFDNKMLVDQPPTTPNTGASYTIEDYIYLAGAPVAAFRSLWVSSGGTFARQPTSDSSSTACEKLSDGGKCGLYHLVTDLQQRPVLMVRDSSKEITQAVSYDAFGNVNRIPVIAGANNNQPQDLATISLPPGTSRIRSRANYVVATSNVITLDGQTIYPVSSVPKAYAVSSWVAPSNSSVLLRILATFPSGPGDGPGIQNDSIEFMRGSSALPLFTNFRGPGQYYDAEHDLFENWHRNMDPKTGRYLSPEPLLRSPGYVGSMAGGGYSVATYAYALNNPLRWTDSTGLKPGDKFKSVDEAARDALEWVRKNKSKKQLREREWSGQIRRVSATECVAEMPKPGPLIKKGDVRAESPAGDDDPDSLGDYHTHPWTSEFSAPDIKMNLDRKYPGYLIGPDGQMVRFAPRISVDPNTGIKSVERHDTGDRVYFPSVEPY
ncbi:MAG: RHS repeat-associated core domain-containing protein [Archangium sp.]|nr:RHS repeat-associated core domain-containing protein [Archangium sp.]